MKHGIISHSVGTGPFLIRAILISLAVMINATYEDLTAVGEDADSAIQLEGGGYLAFTSVYHELHCLVSFLRSYGDDWSSLTNRRK